MAKALALFSTLASTFTLVVSVAVAVAVAVSVVVVSVAVLVLVLPGGTAERSSPGRCVTACPPPCL